MRAAEGPATAAAPEPESGFPLSDAAQRLATGSRTELLIGGARCREEQVVTAGPMARQAGDFFGKIAWALTHGGVRDVRGRVGEKRRLGFAGRRRECVVRGGMIRVRERGTLTSALARAPGLIAAALPAVECRPIALPGPPGAPASGGALASRATVAGLGPARQEPAFTPLEQAASTAGMPSP